MEWFELSITTTSEATDAIANFIDEMGISYCIKDPNDLLGENVWHTDDTIIEKELFEGDNVIIKAYFPTDIDIEKQKQEIEDYLHEISNFVNVGEAKISIDIARQQDWENEWKKYYKPTKIGEKIVIKPTWEEYTPNEGEVIIELDPGVAFGTGTHETTTMCMRHLEKYIDKDSKVLDIGCGSGILGICASKLGAKSILGIDIDEVAVKVSKENAGFNKIDNIEFLQGNLFDVVSDKYNVIVANIVADIIIAMSKSIKDYMDDKGIFISSGIIRERKQDVINALIENGFEILDQMNDGEWISIVATKK